MSHSWLRVYSLIRLTANTGSGMATPELELSREKYTRIHLKLSLSKFQLCNVIKASTYKPRAGEVSARLPNANIFFFKETVNFCIRERETRDLGRSKKLEEQRNTGNRVRRTSTATRRLQNHKMTIELQGNSVSEQKFFSRMPYHEVFGFLIPLLVAVLQVNNQGTNNHSFETHPANLWVFLLATLVYCFVFVSQYYNQSYAQLYSLVAVISGSLSSVSLISVFLPDLPGRLIFIPWAFVSIVVSRSLIISLCCWLYQMIMKTFFQVVGIWIRFKVVEIKYTTI
ncbi:hypothetical protein QYF36_017751 [Acer negundo]|nr:hypothetical protein QYF36_017751 [Acer negundo]